MAKRTPENNRRKLIEEQRKKIRAKERRNTVLVVVVSSVIAIGIIAAAVVFGQKEKGGGPSELRAVGFAAADAGCDPVKEEKVEGEANHTPKNGDPVLYTVHPPTSGRHNPTPLPVGAKKYYSRDDNPPPERAVHNLEHGYIVVWYDKTVPDEQIQALEQAADAAEGKFLIVPWIREDFADDKHIVLTSWGVKQQCSQVSGAVMQEFQDKHGGNKSKAPEKNAI